MIILKWAKSGCNCENCKMELSSHQHIHTYPHKYTSRDAHIYVLFLSLTYITLMQETAWLRHPEPHLWLPFTSACWEIHSFIAMLSWWPVCQERWIMWEGNSGLREDQCVCVRETQDIVAHLHSCLLFLVKQILFLLMETHIFILRSNFHCCVSATSCTSMCWHESLHKLMWQATQDMWPTDTATGIKWDSFQQPC